MKKFYGVIGNPPYQDTSVGDQKTFQKPIYNDFIDAANKVSDRCVLVHPARFLFNAGSTPKSWNRKMLSDEHFKVLQFEPDAGNVFSGVDIKGGIAITLHDNMRSFEPIKVFTPYKELNSAMQKICKDETFESFSNIVVTRTAYRFTDKMHSEHPEAKEQLSKGHAYDVSTNIFERLPQVFHSSVPKDGNDYIRILGRRNNQREYQYIRRDFIKPVVNLNSYKLFLSKAIGSGQFGETLIAPIIGTPATGSTETFISIGNFDTEIEAANAKKYIEGKFSRALLGILKITQDISPDKWAYVPLQDFTSNSDIDWSQSIHDIDQQLYAKYGLSKEEIEFIETHVKEMS